MREVSLHFVRWIVGIGLAAASMLSPIAAQVRAIATLIVQSTSCLRRRGAVVDGVTRQIADKLAATRAFPS